MARDSKSNGKQFDVDGIRQLIELMEKHDLNELKLQQGETRCVLRRGAPAMATAQQVIVPQTPIAAAPQIASASPAAAQSGGGDAAASDEGLVEIKSPTVGTFYESSSPGEPAFVKVGDSVSKTTVVCIVEAMKVFNQIPADVSGTIEKILLKDGDTVEFGQPLFLVRP